MGKKKVLVTGSCGFIFSNFIRYALHKKLPYVFVSIDKLVGEVSKKNIYLNPDHTFYLGDVSDPHFVDNVFGMEKPDYVIHGAAESFVDDSIANANPFINSNVLGTQVIIDACLNHNVDKLVYISTDEVYGQLDRHDDSSWKESARLSPRNPYSASKASAEMLVRAAHETHGLKYNITRSCNNFGPRQSKKNLIPKVIKCILEDQPIPIFGDGLNEREWIYVIDHCTAILKVLEEGVSNETYNIGTGHLIPNLDLVNKICTKMGKGQELITFIEDRKGHDFKYSVDNTKLKSLGWKPRETFSKSLDIAINWYITNRWILR